MNAILGCLSNMFNISGKTKQVDYIIFFLFCLIIGALFGGTITGFFGPTIGPIIGLLLFIIPLFTATVRRFRDAGFSGWWAILSIFFPLVTHIICCILPGK